MPLLEMGQSVSSKVNTQEIEKEVRANPVVIYSKKSCGYCAEAKKLLNNEKINYVEHDLDQVKTDRPNEFNAYVNGLVYMTRITSVPQIFICGKFIGGYTDLAKLQQAKLLLKKIEECTGENSNKW